MMNQGAAKRLRKVQIVLSVLLFVSVFCFMWFDDGFDLTKVQLSKFGVGKMSSLWNLTIITIAVSLIFNTCNYIDNNVGIRFKGKLKFLFIVCFTLLSLTGAFSMKYEIHNVVAWLYFFMLPLCIFSMAFFNRKFLKFSEWKFHTIISVVMVLVPLVALGIFRKGLAIPECSHSLILLIWSIWLVFGE